MSIRLERLIVRLIEKWALRQSNKRTRRILRSRNNTRKD